MLVVQGQGRVGLCEGGQCPTDKSRTSRQSSFDRLGLLLAGPLGRTPELLRRAHYFALGWEKGRYPVNVGCIDSYSSAHLRIVTL